jgi:glycosyltransferase involved in cell wall biosynthesis
MRIGMVAWSFYPRVGGSVTTVSQLSEALINKGVDIDIIAPLLKKDFNKINSLEIDNRIKIHWVISSFATSYTDFYSRFIFFFKMILKIRSISQYVDIFHTHDFNIGLLSAIIGTKKPVVSVFGADPLFEMLNYNKKRCTDYQIFLKNSIIVWLQKIMNMSLSVISKGKLVVISLNENLNQIIKKYFNGRIVYIPVGVNIGLYSTNKAEREHPKENIILVVSRLMPWKDIDLAIDVFREIKKYKQNIEIIFIGDGPLKEHYLAKYNTIKGMTFITGLSYKEIIDYYKKASVLLIPSRYETFSIVILEAMSSGLPIVASDLIVFHDRVRNNLTGYLVKDGNVNEFCSKVLDLIVDRKKRKEIVNNAFGKVKEYDIDKISNKYINLYHELLCGRERKKTFKAGLTVPTREILFPG